MSYIWEIIFSSIHFTPVNREDELIRVAILFLEAYFATNCLCFARYTNDGKDHPFAVILGVTAIVIGAIVVICGKGFAQLAGLHSIVLVICVFIGLIREEFQDDPMQVEIRRINKANNR